MQYIMQYFGLVRYEIDSSDMGSWHRSGYILSLGGCFLPSLCVLQNCYCCSRGFGPWVQCLPRFNNMEACHGSRLLWIQTYLLLWWFFVVVRSQGGLCIHGGSTLLRLNRVALDLVGFLLDLVWPRIGQFYLVGVDHN